MENTYFNNNRKQVQKAFFEARFLIPLIDKTEPIIIEEKNLSASLKEVIIENFPITDEAKPISYLLDLELNQPILGRVEKTKTTELALLLFTRTRLVVFMVEMKSYISNKANKLSSIAQKFEHSMGRISMFLTSYIFNEAIYKNLEVQYVGLVCLHDDKITGDYEEHLLYRNLKEGKEAIFLDNALTGEREKLIIKFLKSEDETQPSMTINFNEIFPEESYNFQAEDSELTLPDIRF